MVVFILYKVVHWAFLVYTLLLLTRVIASWIPRLAYHRWMRFVRFYTDPYLNIFRRIIPPIGGTLDLSPMIGFFALGFLEKIILSIIIRFA